MPDTPTTDEQALEELQADNGRRIEELCRRGLSPVEVSAVIKQVNEDTVWAHLLYHLGRIAAAVIPGDDGDDLVVLARLTAAGKLSRWLDQAEKAVERSKLSVVGNGRRP